MLGVGDSAFSNCDSLTDVIFHGTREQWNSLKAKISNTSGNDALLKAKVTYAQSSFIPNAAKQKQEQEFEKWPKLLVSNACADEEKQQFDVEVAQDERKHKVENIIFDDKRFVVFPKKERKNNAA